MPIHKYVIRQYPNVTDIKQTIQSVHKFDNGITLKTSYDFPPIPIRSMDWGCINPDWYNGVCL